MSRKKLMSERERRSYGYGPLYVIRTDNYEGELPNYLVLLPSGGATWIADPRAAARFYKWQVEEALRAYPASRARAVRRLVRESP